ncbi:MAG: ATP-binding cassette domain-containing protein [Bacteroidota bacterium]|jgi:ABC-type multidrug transport system ATPase subunit|nr:ATP-binding cassette domain-containing protein [Bacteroidota bacterium]|tara:strand:- start:180 stop:782 length:603 start_codon:yes stop_codon:yes gene_type:complete
MEIFCNKVSKNFGSKSIIKNFNKTFKKKSYAILGKNGSGKSTLLKLIANLILPSSGKIEFIIRNKILNNEEKISSIFFTAPYQELISELSVKELISFHYKFRRKIKNEKKLIGEFGLENFINSKIENLSSGTEQKLKLLLAFNTVSEYLILDEPCTNLDEDGKKLYKKMYKNFSKNRGIIIATNDKDDIVDKKTEIISIT